MEDRHDETSMMNLMTELRQFAPSLQIQQRAAHLHSFSDYQAMYERSIRNSDAFWLEQAESLQWRAFPSLGCKYNWDASKGRIEHTWFRDGVLNVCENCVDRHLATRRNKVALIWQGDEDGDQKTLTYGELYHEVCRFANVLKARGIVKGDRVSIYLPMIPELAIAMLACARIGAIHSVIFGGFSAESLAHRMNDSTCKLLVTANEGMRGGKIIRLKEIADQALLHSPSVESVIVVRRTDNLCHHVAGRDYWYHEEILQQESECPAEPMQAEDPLFILYTSGTTGKPKGVVHTQAGYLLHVSLSHRYIFDLHENDIYWCTADLGWITGHSYSLYGPLANGCTTVLFEGVPTYPDAGRFWQIIEKYQVTLFYTAPTVIRSLISKGLEFPLSYRLDSLRVLGSVGEPINPEAWMWYYEVIGKGRCPIVDTWWQTETGGILITPLPTTHVLKPGSATQPFFGVEPVIVRHDGTECGVNEGGSLCIRHPWPGIMRTTWGDHQRFVDTYFSAFKGMYFTGDGCRQDEDSDYWLLGRIDDIVNVSGHRIGTAEVESALVSHPLVAEAAVVPIDDTIKGQALYAFVTVVESAEKEECDQLKKELRQHVRNSIGPIAVPDQIQFAHALPKTRSGKIIRRILRKIASRQIHDIGDVSTLADPNVIQALVQNM